MAREAKLMGTIIPYTVKYVAKILENPLIDYGFPKVSGEPYKVLKFDDRTRTSWTCTYLPVFGGFDIETTNVKDGDFKRAYAYHMQMSVFTWEGGAVYICRTWKEVDALFKAFISFYGLSDEIRTVQWIANAGFE